jgi:hypothetical protein
VQFTASASKTEVATGEEFEITFSTNGNGDQFTPPRFAGFQLTGGPNVSQSMTSVNGNTSVSFSYSYELLAVKEGEYTIGPATIVVNGRRLSTKPITIKVVKGQPVPQNRNAQTGPDNTINDNNISDLSKSVFIRAIVNKTNVYQGEQLTVSYRLYTRVSIVNAQPDKLPDLNGFFAEDTKSLQQQSQWRVEVYNGIRYNVTDIKQSILFPERSGDLTVDPFGMTLDVRTGDDFDQLFGSAREFKTRAQSKPVIIHVKPLPGTGKPSDFSGAVGNFSIAASVDKKELKSNESLNYTIKVSGAGNIKLLKPFSPEFPADFEKYDPKVTDSVKEDENGLRGTRNYTYLLIPRHKGDYTINPLKFSYFNPATGRYNTIATKEFHIHVSKGLTENNVTAFAEGDKQDVKLLDKDIRFIKNNTQLSKQDDLFFGSVGYFFLLALGPLACIAAFNYRNWYRKNNSDLVKVKSRKAGKLAAQHLAEAEKYLLTNQKSAFYEATSKGLYGYISDKFNILPANLNRENIETTLKQRKVNDAAITRLLETLDLCEMARYAPVNNASDEKIFETAKNIINEIEAKD